MKQARRRLLLGAGADLATMGALLTYSTELEVADSEHDWWLSAENFVEYVDSHLTALTAFPEINRLLNVDHYGGFDAIGSSGARCRDNSNQLWKRRSR